MTFGALLAWIQALLQHEQRFSYRALKIRFEPDGDHLEVLKEELIYAKWLAADEDGRVLVWIGAADLAPAPLPRPAAPAPPDQERGPRATFHALLHRCRQRKRLNRSARDWHTEVRARAPVPAYSER